MKLENFILKEFKKIIIFELDENNEKFSTIRKELINSNEIDFQQLISIVETYQLPQSEFLVNQYEILQKEQFQEFDIISIESIKDDALLGDLASLLWIICKLEIFFEAPVTTEELTDFYNYIFNNFSELIELEDFMYETGLLSVDTFDDEWNSKAFKPVFKSAVENCPNKYNLYAYYVDYLIDDGEYEEAIKYVELVENNILNQNFSYTIDFDYESYLMLLSSKITACYVLNKYDTALDQCNLIISYIKKNEDNDDTYLTFVEYDDILLIRASIYLKTNQKELLKEDIDTFISINDINYINNWEYDYVDLDEIITYIKSNYSN